MNTRLIIQYSGYNESGSKTDKKYTILNIKGEVTMDRVIEEIVKQSELSPFRRNKSIDIHHIQAF